MFKLNRATGFATILLLLFMTLICASSAKADNFSFIGNFTRDDNIQFFNFSVGAPSNVTLRSFSYAGGVNSAGQVIARGGFDPILALFNRTTGALIAQQDDAGSGVPADSITGRFFDVNFMQMLSPGEYTVSVMQFDNFAVGPNLSSGFTRQGTGNFTTMFGTCPSSQFVDVSGVAAGRCRNGNWAFDILNVNAAEQVPPITGVPEPATMTLLGTGLAGFVWRRRRRRHPQQATNA